MRNSFEIKNQEKTAFLILFFIIWPFGAFLYALKHFRDKKAKVIFILFAMLYGFTFMHRADSERVAGEFVSVANLQGKEVWEYLNTKTDRTIDIFLPLTNVIVSRFSSSAHVLYMVYALIYFSLVIASFYLLYEMKDKNRKLSFTSILFLFLFLLYIRYSAINGVRFWIACFVFTYGIIKLIFHENPKFLFLISITPFIHFSYFFMFPVMAIYFLFRKNLYICYGLLIFSLATTTVIESGFVESLGIFSPTRSERMEIYLYEGNVENRLAARENTRWVIRYGAIIAQWTMAIAIFFPSLLLKIKLSKSEKYFFAFLIVFLSALQFTISSFELHRRFFELFILLGIIYFFKLSLKEEFKIKPLSIAITLLLTPQILFGLRASFETTNIGLFLSNIFTAHIFNKNPFSLAELLDLFR